MDPVSTGVGLAASLVTLLGLAANSCKTLHELQQKLRSAPEDIQRLVVKLETFKALLAVTERESRNHSSDKVPLELQQIWIHCEATMQKDLQDFADLATKLNASLEGPTVTGKMIRVRARSILSEQAVRKCEDAFDQYKGVLDSVQGILNGSQTRAAIKSIGEQALKVNRLLNETQASRSDTRAVLDQLQACDIIPDTGVAEIFPCQHGQGREDLYQIPASPYTLAQREPRTIKTVINQLERETQAIRSGLIKMDQCRSDEHSTIRHLLVAVGENQGALANRLGYIETDPTSQIESRMCLSETSRITLSSRTLQGKGPTSGRLWKTVYWKWSIYKFPIGVLSIETSREKAYQPFDPESSAEDRTSLTFTFAPPSWIWSSLINVCYTLSAEAHALPYWQRTQSGVMSLLPPRVMECLRDDDYMALGGLFSDLSCQEVDDLGRHIDEGYRAIHRLPHLRNVLLPGRRIALSTEMYVSYTRREDDWTYWRHKLHVYCDGKRLPLLITLIFSRGRPSENKLPTKEVFNFRIGHGYNLADGDIEDDIRGLIAGSGIETVPPNLYISSSTPQGFCDFKKYIAQHLDPLSCRELSIMNKWWISAMMYSDCRFKSIMEAQLNSFQTHNTLKDTSKGTLSLRSGFDYSRCVQEVLEASMPDRIVFLLWVSAYGTEAMWDAFISAGVDLHEGQRPRPSYLECAARAHNLPTFQFLLKAGARSTHGLRNFVVLDDASEDDIHFVEGLLQHGFPPSELKDGLDEPISYLFMYFHAKRWLEVTTQSLRIVAQKLVSSGNGSYSHPPYHRSYYLGPDVLRAIAYRNTPLLVHLIEMGASLEYVGYGRFTNGYTALQTALELGYSDVLKALLSSATGYAERKSALLLAYSNARLNLDSSHPRRAREIEPYLEHNTGYHDLEYSYWAHYPERLGASYEIDLECHHLICSALKDLGVDVPFASQQDSAGGDDIGHRYVASYISYCKDVALCFNDTLRHRMHTLFFYDLVRYRKWLRSVVQPLTRMTTFDFLLVTWAFVEILRTMFFCLVWDIGAWLFKIPRPPKVVRYSLFVLFSTTLWMYYTRG